MKNDRVFTADLIVRRMLDGIGYSGSGIDGRRILEPSFGDGAFLVEIVRRILDRYVDCPVDTVFSALSMVHGMEINHDTFRSAVDRLDALLAERGIHGYGWPGLVCGDMLSCTDGIRYDYIIGNPPYVRLHDLDHGMRSRLGDFRFGNGTTDMYILFYEKCMGLLGSGGKLCFITPNSYFKNASQGKFREWVAGNGFLSSIWDYGNIRVFDADTYTAVALMDASGNGGRIRYALMDGADSEKYHVWLDSDYLSGKKPWRFGSARDMEFLDCNRKLGVKLGDICTVRNGISTNADGVYVVSQDTVERLGLELARPAVKASTLDSGNCIIFPYRDEGGTFVVIPEDEMKESFPNTYAYLSARKDVLCGRDMDGNGSEWYRYARSQGIQDTGKKKIALKHFISSGENPSAEWLECTEGTIVYSGMYITFGEENESAVKSVLGSSHFGRYLFLCGKNVSGGYRTVNTLTVKEYGIGDSDASGQVCG